MENRKGDGSMISSFDYARDAVGNPISIEREDGYTVYYEYDARHQLTRETHVDEGDVIYAWEWDYDAAGNREFQVFNGEATYYEYNAANELTTETKDGQTTYYHYDRCGNTTAKQEVAGTTYYHWDYENLLTQIDLPDGAHNYFAYDADGKRVSKRDSEGFTEFIYQGPDMLRLQLERNDAGETQVHYTMGAGLESMRRGEASSFYHYDWLGSTHELTDGEQVVTDTYLYNAWGEVLVRTGTATSPHTYGGEWRYYAPIDALLYQLGLRYYASHIARFIQPDSIFEEEGYIYTGGQPTRLIDPTGLKSIGGLPLVNEAKYSPWNSEPIRDITRPAPQNKASKMPSDMVVLVWAYGAMYKAIRNGWWVAFGAWYDWISGYGRTRTLDMHKWASDNPEVQKQFQDEGRHVYQEVQRLRLGPGKHRLISGEWRFPAHANPDWQLALNTYFGYGIADVCVSGNCVKINLTVWRWDPFEFDCDALPYRPPGSVGHAHTSATVTDYVNEAKQIGSFKFCQ